MTNIEEIQLLWRTLPLAAENDLQALDRQVTLNPAAWQAVARFLLDTDLNALPLGRNEIGEGAFANVQEYETKTESMYELHRRYIDVQLLTRGEELVYMAPATEAHEPQGTFDTDADFILYASASSEQSVTVSPQSYLILYPSDAHKPCMAIGGKSRPVRKIVVKIPYIE